MAILEAARYAPSCFNEQPWRYIVARNEEEKLKYLSILAKPTNHITVNRIVFINLTQVLHGVSCCWKRNNAVS